MNAAGLEVRPEDLVQIRGDLGERLEEPNPAKGAGGGDELGGRLVADPGREGDILGEDLAVIELEGRDNALGIEGEEVVAGLGALGLQADADVAEVEPRLMQGDMGGQAAGAGGKVEDHGAFSSRGENGPGWGSVAII